MSLTIEFYSAEPQELVTLFAANPASADDFTLFDKLHTYPMAEFPGRLLIPNDLDSLCEALRKHSSLVPPRFHDLCIKQLWNDGFDTESLTLLSDQFVGVLAAFDENEIRQAALDWASTFPYQELLDQSPTYRAVLQLREVARDAAVHKKSLIYYLAGSPGFFDYLRSL